MDIGLNDTFVGVFCASKGLRVPLSLPCLAMAAHNLIIALKAMAVSTWGPMRAIEDVGNRNRKGSWVFMMIIIQFLHCVHCIIVQEEKEYTQYVLHTCPPGFNSLTRMAQRALSPRSSPLIGFDQNTTAPVYALLPIGFCSIISPSSLLANNFIHYIIKSNNLNMSFVTAGLNFL